MRRLLSFGKLVCEVDFRGKKKYWVRLGLAGKDSDGSTGIGEEVSFF